MVSELEHFFSVAHFQNHTVNERFFGLLFFVIFSVFQAFSTFFKFFQLVFQRFFNFFYLSRFRRHRRSVHVVCISSFRSCRRSATRSCDVDALHNGDSCRRVEKMQSLRKRFRTSFESKAVQPMSKFKKSIVPPPHQKRRRGTTPLAISHQISATSVLLQMARRAGRSHETCNLRGETRIRVQTRNVDESIQMAGRLPTQGSIQGQRGASRKYKNKCQVVLVQGPLRDVVVGESILRDQRSGKQRLYWEAGTIDKRSLIFSEEEETLPPESAAKQTYTSTITAVEESQTQFDGTSSESQIDKPQSESY